MELRNVTVIALIFINVDQYILLQGEFNRRFKGVCGDPGICQRQSEKRFGNGKTEML